jgi:hypothetical protein
MIREAPRADELVKTEAEQVSPPEPTVPEPSANRPEEPASPVPWGGQAGGAATDAVLREVKELADRVGGLRKLRDLVDLLMKMRR